MSENAKKFSRLGAACYVFTAFFTGLWGATQFVAWKTAYHPSLGFNLHGVYPPWDILVWWRQGGYEALPDIFVGGGSAGMGITAVMLIGFIICRTVSDNTSRVAERLHGSARWANREDIEEAGFLKDKGVFIGGWKDPKTGKCHYLRHEGNLHVLALAPTRSGKGVCLVVPTLQTWLNSSVVTDLKGELWALTAGWRQKYAKQKVLRFEPAAPHGSVKWNPLDEIRLETEYETGDVQNLAGILIDPDGKGFDQGGSSAHFNKLARSLITGLIIHPLYRRKRTGEPACLGEIDFLLENNLLDDLFWEQLKVYEHREVGGKWKPHPLVVKSAQDIINTPTKERGSVLTTTKNALNLYRDEVVARNTSCSEFHIAHLMDYESPVTLYIIAQTADNIRLRPLIRVLLNMICRRLATRMEFVRQASGDVRAVSLHKHKLLMLIDEFPSFGKLEVIQENLAFLAGYGIRFYLIAQDMEQLVDAYGEHQTITANTHIQCAFAPQVLKSIQYISRMTGQTTVFKNQITTSGARMSPYQKQVSQTIQEVSRPLMTEDEVMRMPKAKMDGDNMIEGGDMLIFLAGTPVIYGKQMPYFLDPILKARTGVEPPADTDRIIEPVQEQEVNLEQVPNTCEGIFDEEQPDPSFFEA